MINKFWKEYLENENLCSDLKYTGTVCFGTEAQVANNAANMVMSGDMRATIYPAQGYRCAMCGAPKAGNLNVVVDWMGNPVCVIKTTDVQEFMVSELTDEMCKLEGGAQTAEQWRESQMPLVKTEVEELGFEFSDETMLYVESFKKEYPAE